jgi:hypothetical protein
MTRRMTIIVPTFSQIIFVSVNNDGTTNTVTDCYTVQDIRVGACARDIA